MADTTNARYCANCSCVLLQPVEDAGETRTARMEELLRQNLPLLDVELPAFRKIAKEARATLEDLDSKIVQAQELLETLVSARQCAQSRLEETKTILHPMRSIPNELLIEIFHHCIPKTYSVHELDAIDPRRAPWLFTGVCYRWRDLAITSSQLWTYLSLNLDVHVGSITPRQCAYKVGLFLQRSRDLPITVYLESGSSLRDHPVLPVLEVSIPRWRHLDVILPRSHLQCLSRNNFSALHTLKILKYDYEDEEEENVIVDIFKSASAPVLRTLKLSIRESWRNLEHVALPWSRLTSLVHFPIFDADASKTLRILTDLEDLTVDLDPIDDNYAPIRDMVPLPKLRRLTIIENEDVYGRCKELFSALIIPTLSELTLIYDHISVVHFPTSPASLEQLTKLDITCAMDPYEENTEHLLDFLTLTRHVECLHLHDLDMTLEFVDGLNLDNRPDGSPVRLPCLRILDIGKCRFAYCLDDDVDSFFAMLYSRLPTVEVEGSQGGEETVDSCIARRDGTGQNAMGMEFDPRSRLHLEDRRRCLKKVQLPRWLYVQMRTERKDIFLELTSRVELECAVTMKDLDS